MRQAGLERCPVAAVILGIVKPVARARENQALLVRILGDATHVRQWIFRRQIAVDLRPCLSEVGGLIDVRIAIVHQVKINGNVRGAGIKVRRLDTRNRAPGGQARDVLRDVIPIPAAILRVPNLPVVGARPNQALLYFRWRNRKHDLAIELSQVVTDDSAGRLDVLGILC